MLAALVTHLTGMPARAGEPVDLELLLAVDVSSSVDKDEFELQIRGLAAAFRHPDVQAAIGAAGQRGVAVALMTWSDYAQQTLEVNWTLVRDAAGAARLADIIDSAGRTISGGGTEIAGAINHGMDALIRNGFDGQRQVIDISGDGRSTFTALTEMARDRAVARGVMINGLAILNDDPALDQYYWENVIGGTASFVLAAADYEAFAAAIIAKLTREIAETPVARARSRAGPIALRQQGAGRALAAPDRAVPVIDELFKSEPPQALGAADRM